MFLLIGIVLSFSLNANQTQAQKITVEVNVACDDGGVNDAQVWIGGTLVDLSAPPRATARVEIAPGTYVIKASRKSFPNAVVKDIYMSNLVDQFPRKYEPASPGGDISLALDRQSKSPSGLDYSMRIDLEGCVPGGGPVAAATPSPTPAEGLANVHFYVTWMCRGDVQETFVRPLFGATVKIDGQEHETETMQSGTDFIASTSVRGLRPGQHRVTVLLPAEGEDYEFAYVASGTESVFPGSVPPEKYYPDQAGDVVVTLKEGEQSLYFRLIRDCSERFSQNYKYEVLKLKGRWSDYRVDYGDQRLGHPPLNEGGTVGNGDVIETSSEGGVLLEAKYVGPGKAPNESRYYVMVHPSTKVRLFFIKGERDEYVPKFFVQYGTISQKVIDDPAGLPRREKNTTVTVEDPTAVGFDNGTIFSWSYERQRQETTISVEEGSVAVKPQNPRLQPVTVGPGQQILVSRISVSPVRPAPRISDVDLGNGVSLARVGKSGSGAGGTTAAGRGGTGGTTLGGIGGTWTAPTGEIIELIQKGNRITGRYNGILGLGEISGTFDGKNLSATVQPNQGLLPLAIPLRLTLTEGGKLLGRLETPLISGSLVFTKNR